MNIVNVTSYEWSVVLSRPTGEIIREAHLPRRGAMALDLPAGDYVIDQRVIARGGNSLPPRRFPTALAGGQTYRWQLATLLSGHTDAPPPGPPQP